MLRLADIAPALGLMLVLARPAAAVPTCPLEQPEVSYAKGVFEIRFCLRQTPYAGDAETLYVGCTVIRDHDGFEYDLPAKQITFEETARPITMKARVGPGYSSYIVALWDQKVPCTRGRHGCEQYGYALDSSVDIANSILRSIGYFVGRIGPPRVEVIDGGGGAQMVERVSSTLRAGLTQQFWLVSSNTLALREQRAPLEVVIGQPASNTRDHIEILHRTRHPGLANDIAKLLEDKDIHVRWVTRHWPEAPVDIVVVVGSLGWDKALLE